VKHQETGALGLFGGVGDAIRAFLQVAADIGPETFKMVVPSISFRVSLGSGFT